MLKNTKRFDEWDVDCNECELYWVNQCDGVQKAQKRTCTSFKATRSVVIPQELNALKTRLKWLTGVLACLGASQVIMFIIILIYYFGKI